MEKYINQQLIEDRLHEMNLSWRKLADQMGLSHSGVRKSILHESIRAKDLFRLSQILMIPIQSCFVHSEVDPPSYADPVNNRLDDLENKLSMVMEKIDFDDYKKFHNENVPGQGDLLQELESIIEKMKSRSNT